MGAGTSAVAPDDNGDPSFPIERQGLVNSRPSGLRAQLADNLDKFSQESFNVPGDRKLGKPEKDGTFSSRK
jgi:hypothetical protein